MLQRLRPWQAAAALTGIAFVVQLLLLVPQSRERGVTDLPPMRPTTLEIALNGVGLVVLFLVLWLVFATLASLKARRERARGA